MYSYKASVVFEGLGENPGLRSVDGDSSKRSRGPTTAVNGCTLELVQGVAPIWMELGTAVSKRCMGGAMRASRKAERAREEGPRGRRRGRARLEERQGAVRW